MSPERLIELLAEVSNVDLHDVGIPLEREVPHVVEDLRLRDHLADAAHEELQHRELTGRQHDLDITSHAAMRHRVDGEVTGPCLHRLRATCPSDERADTSEQDHERERLGQEVVGSRVQGLGVVVLAVLRGEHQDWCPVTGVAELLAYLVAVQARQHDVEHDDVVSVLGRHPEAVGTRSRDVDREPLRLQAPPHGGRHPLLVFDDEHAHAGDSLAPKS